MAHLLAPMLLWGPESIRSMGNVAALAVLSTSRSFFNKYFKQLSRPGPNHPGDCIRERWHHFMYTDDWPAVQPTPADVKVLPAPHPPPPPHPPPRAQIGEVADPAPTTARQLRQLEATTNWRSSR